MAVKELPSAEELRKFLRYEPDTGKLFWCGRCDAFDGKEAFTARTKKGYRVGRFFGTLYYAHRLVWVIVHGVEPAGQIDHINGVTCDNRLVNLRDVPASLNCRNTKRRADNTSGYANIQWCKRRSRWNVHFTENGRQRHIKSFADKRDAVDFRDHYAKSLGQIFR